jgi:hypothetical protein
VSVSRLSAHCAEKNARYRLASHACDVASRVVKGGRPHCTTSSPPYVGASTRIVGPLRARGPTTGHEDANERNAAPVFVAGSRLPLRTFMSAAATVLSSRTTLPLTSFSNPRGGEGCD